MDRRQGSDAVIPGLMCQAYQDLLPGAELFAEVVRASIFSTIACEMSASVQQFEHFWHCPLGLERKLTFPVLLSLLSFPDLLAY